MDPARYPDAESYLQAQHELFFGAPIVGDFHGTDWRVALAGKHHPEPRLPVLRRQRRARVSMPRTSICNGVRTAREGR